MEVLVLTKPDCHFCDPAREILERLARDYSLQIAIGSFESEDGEALAARHGALFPPVIFIDGDFFCYGRVSERRLRRELDRRLAVSESG